MTHFCESFNLIYVPRGQNAKVNLLSKLASMKKSKNHRLVI